MSLQCNRLEEFLSKSRVDNDVFALRPDYHVMLLAVEGLVPGPSDQASEALLRTAEIRARDATQDQAVDQLSHVAAWRGVPSIRGQTTAHA